MKTIEIKTNGQIAQFTTKSVTFDGKEFFYSKMENLKHDSADHTYYFTYDGESKVLPYDAKYEKVLNAIFSQVENLKARRAAQTAANVSEAAKPENAAAVQSTAETHSSGAPVIKDVMNNAENAPEPEAGPLHHEEAPDAGKTADTAEPAANEADEQTEPAEPVVFTDKKAAKQAEKERKKAEKAKKREEKEKMKAEKAALKASGKSPDAPEDKSGAETPVEDSYDPKNDPERKRKIKKSVITFAIVVAAIAVIAAVCYFIFGTSDNPSSISPNSEESQQYEDIDEMIDDLRQ